MDNGRRSNEIKMSDLGETTKPISIDLAAHTLVKLESAFYET